MNDPYGNDTPSFFRKEYNNPDNLGNGEPYGYEGQEKQETSSQEVVIVNRDELVQLIQEAVNQVILEAMG